MEGVGRKNAAPTWEETKNISAVVQIMRTKEAP